MNINGETESKPRKELKHRSSTGSSMSPWAAPGLAAPAPSTNHAMSAVPVQIQAQAGLTATEDPAHERPPHLPATPRYNTPPHTPRDTTL